MSFVIGLPGDNLEKTKASINFYKKMKADRISLNQIIPFRGTAAREWFEKNKVKLSDEVGFGNSLTLFGNGWIFVETDDFTADERQKAFYMFHFRVRSLAFKVKDLPNLIYVAVRYNLYLDFLYWLPKAIMLNLKRKKLLVKKGLKVLQKEGVSQLIRRYKTRSAF